MTAGGIREFKRVLVANRGEIALRIVRACHDAGLSAVAVYADPDAGTPVTRAADEAVRLPGDTPAETYLDAAALLAAAAQTGADAVHPGYGFLAENAEFAGAVRDAGLVWIGPPPDVIRALGDKVRARAIAARAGAPMAAGTPRPLADAAEAEAFAAEHGLPVAIKAAHGGGGRGLRIAREPGEVTELFEAAVREATAAFGSGECFVETYIERGRHVEVQVLADAHGSVQAVGTRDCTLQRRYQKLVEEAPAPWLTEAQRARLEEAAAAICREAGYVNAGTVEFLLAPDGSLNFLEVNTRLQVEHTVTEETADLDLVRAQLRIAAGHRLDATTAEQRRHAIEFRINAEDPQREFAPCTGTITRFRPPSGPGVRARCRRRGRVGCRHVVRLAAGQADRRRRRPGAGAPAGAPRAGRIRDRGRGHDAALPARGRGRPGVHRLRTPAVRRAHPVGRAGLPDPPRPDRNRSATTAPSPSGSAAGGSTSPCPACSPHRTGRWRGRGGTRSSGRCGPARPPVTR